MVDTLILGTSIFFGFFVQSVIGFAAPIVALPGLIYLLGIQKAVALNSIFLLFFSVVMVKKSWKEMNKKVVLELSIGSVFGVFIGVYILQYGSPIILKKLLGAFILFYIIHQFWSKKKIKQFQRFGWIFGFIAGLFSGMFSSGSPFYVSYIYNKVDKPAMIRGTVIGTLAVGNLLRFVLLVHDGLINASIFKLALMITPFFIASVVAGNLAYKHVNEDIFKKVVMIFLILSGISLLLG